MYSVIIVGRPQPESGPYESLLHAIQACPPGRTIVDWETGKILDMGKLQFSAELVWMEQ